MLNQQDANNTSVVERKTEAAAVEGPLEEAVLENSNQFYRWHSELEAARILETEEKYKEYAASLRSHIGGLEAQQAKVSQELIVFDSSESIVKVPRLHAKALDECNPNSSQKSHNMRTTSPLQQPSSILFSYSYT